MTQDDGKLESARLALKTSLGLVAFLAGADKFVGLLADWPRYLSPVARAILPVAPETFMSVVGVVEMAVGIVVLSRWTRVGSYVAMVWLLAIAANLVLGGSFLDVAARDVVMAAGAYALARLTEARAAAAALAHVPAAESGRGSRIGAAA